MEFEELLRRVPRTGLFRTGDVLAGERQPAHVLRQFERWRKSGRITQLRRGVYLLERPFRAEDPHPFCAASLLRRASYVSLQSALAHYGMIPENVPATTAVTGGRPEDLATPLGRFVFRHVSRDRFTGFGEREVAPGQTALVASPEKAVIDLLYLTPRSDDAGWLAELRLEFPERFSFGALAAEAARMRSAKTMRAIGLLRSLAARQEAWHDPVAG